MSTLDESFSSSSNISSNYQSPAKAKTNIEKNKISIINNHPDIIFAKILLHILSENKNPKILQKNKFKSR